MHGFATALESGRVLLMDGAMGTELQRAGIAESECYEAWNLTQPEKVRAIHESYVAAGAEVLVANTFQANANTLARYQQDGNLTAIIQAGVAAARAALSGSGWVLVDVGPFPNMELETVRPILDACREADAVLLETFAEPAEISVFLRASQSGRTPNKPILVSFTFDGTTLSTFKHGTPEKCAEAVAAMGAAALGVNCGRELDMRACAQILERYRAVTALPLFARPNAGTPSAAREYPRSPSNMAARLPELLQAGAVMVGGCCGTTPRHIQAFREFLDNQPNRT
jgi:5-methyltetrahydrofolate--homocysteine methyltransferase